MSDETIVQRCLMDFIKRGGISEENAAEVASRVIESLKLLGSKDAQNE